MTPPSSSPDEEFEGTPATEPLDPAQPEAAEPETEFLSDVTQILSLIQLLR